MLFYGQYKPYAVLSKGVLQCGWLGSPKFMHYYYLRVLGFSLHFAITAQNFSVLDFYLDPAPHDDVLTVCAGACVPEQQGTLFFTLSLWAVMGPC